MVSSVRANEEMHKKWQRAGVIARSKCWDSSVHVLHYKEHPEEYTHLVDDFVNMLNITKAPKRNVETLN